MELLIEAEAPPLTRWDDGSIRVDGTRLLLETIITAYKMGDCPEEIAASFPAASLRDIYAVITYYLGHKDEVEEYLTEVEREGAALQAEIEARCPRDPNLKARLLQRRAEMEAERNAPAHRR